ncbi:MAG: hypothetical protein OSA77_01195 [Halioglobus sp.]|nr:hypothetical protein [Halioglobus sp.]
MALPYEGSFRLLGVRGGSVKVIACIEDQDVIDRILAYLREKEQDLPTLPLLTPPPRAPPDALPIFA